MKKKILIVGAVLLSLVLVFGGVVWSGVLTFPNQAVLNPDTLVESRDILQDQYQRELAILADYGGGSYGPESPYIVQDPYQANPLSALMLFETSQPMQLTVEVEGKDSYSTFAYTYQEFRTHHEAAVLGLYPDQLNRIVLTLTAQDGKKQEYEQFIPTVPLPYDFPQRDILASKPDQMEPGLDLMIPCFNTSYTYLLDGNGDVRGYFSNRDFGHGTAMRVLKNERMISTGDVMKLMPYNIYTLWEWNLLGKVFTEYEIPNAVHHDVIELSNGDFLAASSNANAPLNYDTREDVIIRIERSTGLVRDEYDLRKVLDENRKPYNHYDPGLQNAPNHDWMHLNTVVMDESSNSILFSSPIQSAVVKINADTQEIDWILSSPEGWDGAFSRFQKYLLQQAGPGFEWQWGQHAISVLPDSDGNPNTMDLLIFDNGQARSYAQATSLAPEKNYSRAVIYRIDEEKRTVEQLWQYGKERRSEAYATFLGDANYLPGTGNINIAFGGMLRNNGTPVDDIVMGVLGYQQVQSRVVEVQQDGQVVFDVSVTPRNSSSAETYHVTKLNLYGSAIDVPLGKVQGQRLGTIQSAKQVEYRLPNFFIKRFQVNFRQIYQKSGYLIMEGNFLYNQKSYLLGKLLFVLKSQKKTYIYASNGGLNGNFYARIDLSEMDPGEYAIYVAGGVAEGMDAAGKVMPGYDPTGYKIQVK